MQLLPNPRQVQFLGGEFQLPERALIVLEAPEPQQLIFGAGTLQVSLQDYLGLPWEIVAGHAYPESQVGVVLSVVPGGVSHPQGYALTITEERIYGVAGSPQGMFYAIQTLKQILLQAGRTLPAMRITDEPDFPHRGVMLDISRDKVPTMATLHHLVDLLASWKINQLQLYTEHTFAYRNHPQVWAGASPMTGEEILKLDAWCRERFIELVPNQNAFGHMRRWLVHPEYRHLAECPQGCDTLWGRFDEPFTLCPGDAGSFKLVQSLWDELLPHFHSRQVNVGCDETVDLGQGRSKALAEKIGVGRVYLDFLLKIYHDLKARGRTMQFWGDVILHHPELVPELPRDLIALEWGYEADHPFEEHGKVFAESGIPFYVCPGTSSWNTVGGRTENALGNLLNAAENGLKTGAVGYLITDWGDNGHWQPLPVSYLGLAYGAGVSWCLETNRDGDVDSWLDDYAFQDHARLMGGIAAGLGRVHEPLALQPPNATILFRILQATTEDIAAHIVDSPERVGELKSALEHIDETVAPIGEVQIQRPDADLLVREFLWVAGMLRHACWRGIWAAGKCSGEEDQHLRRHLAEEAGGLREEFEYLWHARNRPGGFTDSVSRLERMRSDYVA